MKIKKLPYWSDLAQELLYKYAGDEGGFFVSVKKCYRQDTNWGGNNMGAKKDNNLITKKWTNANGNGNGNGNGHHPSIEYSTSAPNEKSYLSVGDTWTVTTDRVIRSFKVLAIEDIIIPAGKYRCFKIMEEIKNSGVKNHYWFASSIGLVKCEMRRMTAVLQNYSV
ncbi:MAG: hypothetical protein WA240_03765 [Nitrospirota bacterium]